MEDRIGVLVSLRLLLFFILLMIVLIGGILYFEKDITAQQLRVWGDIFSGVGIGIVTGTIFAFSIRTQLVMFSIYGFAGLISIIVGAILKNL